ncbi:hypothetical protein P7C73_g4051, partial [Tremellales sp. Uapishka_1]
MTDYKFEGWGGFDKESHKGNLKWFEYKPKHFDDDDIDIKIMYCGICGSDVHTLSSGWGDMSKLYPQVVGHEIVGIATRVGDKAEKGIKVGDLVGVGAQCDSCLECGQCKNQREQYCDNGQVGTYAGVFGRNEASKGDKSYGGYANYWRGPSHFVVKIPDNIDPAVAAPMLCGGVTLYSPLKQYGAGTTAKKVGIVGVGGLGHFGILFAKALGAEVTAISHSDHKREDAKELGATNFISTGDDAAKACAEHTRSLDLIINTSNDENLPIDAYITLLKPGGHFIMVGVPEVKQLPNIAPQSVIMNNIHVGGSAIGAPSTIEEMLAFAGEHKVQPWIKKWSLKDANEAVSTMTKARFRYVLVNEDNGGKM